MTALTIELQNNNDLDLFLSFAKRINAKIINIKDSKSEAEKSSVSPISFLEQLAEEGGVSAIDNPSEWQREIRKDKQF